MTTPGAHRLNPLGRAVRASCTQRMTPARFAAFDSRAIKSGKATVLDHAAMRADDRRAQLRSGTGLRYREHNLTRSVLAYFRTAGGVRRSCRSPWTAMRKVNGSRG